MKLIRAQKGVLVGRLQLAAGACRAKDAEGDHPPGIRGISAPWESWTTLYESPSIRIREQYKRGCFDEAINGTGDVRCMFNHERTMILGRRAAGTMRIADSKEGMEYEVDVNMADPMAMGVFARVARGDVAGASCWFLPTEVQTTARQVGGRQEYDDTIVKADLYECGPVTDGAYSDATATARDILRAAADASYRKFKRALEAAGG